MTKETMTVHKALVEVKVLNNRIQKSIDGCEYVLTAKQSDTKVGGVDIETRKADIRDKYKSIQDMIRRCNAIKAAVIHSNAVTMVNVAGKEYTVAAAIDMKDRAMALTQTLLNSMKNAYRVAAAQADKDNKDLEQRAERFITSTYSSTDMKGAAAEVEEARLKFINNQTVAVIDPLNIQEEVKRIESELDSFFAEIDAALSVSNAITQIEIEY